MKSSLEVEYWVVDESGDLVSSDTLLDVSAQVDPEFVEPMIELKTTPCESMRELQNEFLDLLEHVVAAAREQGKRLVPLATPLSSSPAEIPFREKRGTNLQRQIVGPTFDDARVCAGTHIHFEQSNVVDQLNTLTAIDPAFALVNSSSHYRGESIVSCARPYLYRRSCYNACPEQGQLWPYVNSVEEWEQRLESAYETFRDRALEHGIDPAAFDDEFEPYDAVWTPVRLRQAMPTVEWRSPDAALPSQVFQLAEEVGSLVAYADAHGAVVSPDTMLDDTTDEPLSLPAFETVENVVDAAIHNGLADPSVQQYLTQLGFTPSSYTPFADRLPDRRLTDREAATIRLEAAAELEGELTQSRAQA
ncbi:glutamate-cysteine ligase family protein [Natronolimnobius baerhuensis]|uniref:Glutamate--cysteine ligase n=1 Tax=Natronolimnobius baerhuensis TaxID=253108 RepID=A0A202E9K0_9EURY|nr:glutamate-cysteine ligase family protein [Natronolimnobius baerhuensis]OVE84932.1 glutamate--cysteine ligase [Natronolimnobius baerhuensis]